MPSSEINITSLDHEQLKQGLIEFLQTKEEFQDFDYEGSAINTMVDLLTRNTAYDAFLANMLANESFIKSAQIRGNVVSHASKLSYEAKSRTAARAIVDVEVIPASTDNIASTIVMEPGTVFLAAVNGTTYTFTTRQAYTLVFSQSTSSYRVSGVDLYQGQYLTNNFIYTGDPLIIPNMNADMSTLAVTVTDSNNTTSYMRAETINDLGADRAVYYQSENLSGKFSIEFGRDVVGMEPEIDSIIRLSYVNTEDEHGNNVSSFVAASSISGYSNINISVVQNSYGGQDREDIEDIRFIAPKSFQAQNRAVSPSDYEVIVRENFSFIRSVKGWGGEENDPPRYGNVFLSVLPQNNIQVTASLANQIESVISEKNVGSVTPIVISPNVFKLGLNIQYLYDPSLTNKTQSEIDTTIKNLSFQYSENQLFGFSRYFNESELNSILKDEEEIETVLIDYTMGYDITAIRNIDTIYDVFFDNPIVPGTVNMEGFSVSVTGSNHRVYDDEEGNIILTYNDSSGSSVTRNIGTVDYTEGRIEFNLIMVQNETTVRISASPQEENFNVRRNNVVQIETVDTELLQRR